MSVERGTYNGLPTMCEAGGGDFASCIGRCATLSCEKWWLYEGGSLVEIVGSEVAAIDWCTRDLPKKSYTRDDLVRAILGQQWAVAIALHEHVAGRCEIPWHNNCCKVKSLPSPDDVVTAMEQA